MQFLYKIGRPLGAAAGMILSGAVLASCVAAPYPPEAGYPPPGVAAGAPPEAGPSGPAPSSPEYAQNAGPQGGGYYNPPGGGGYGATGSEGYGPPPGGGGYGAPGSEGYGPPPGGGYGPPAAEGYGPPPGGGYGAPGSQGYGPPPGGGYGGPGMTREQFIARAQHRAVVHGRDPELAARRAARKFNRIDTDHNGVIEPGEMQAWRAAHAPRWRAQGAAPPPGYGPPASPSPYQQ